MPTETILVKFINQPRQAGGKYGSVKDARDEYWSVPASMLGQFVVNGTATVEYDTTQKDGKTYKNIKKLVVGGNIPSPFTAKTYHEDPVKAEQIAVLALVKPWIEKIDVGDTEALLHAIKSCRVAWRKAYEKPVDKIESGRRNDDLNDEIPEEFR